MLIASAMLVDFYNTFSFGYYECVIQDGDHAIGVLTYSHAKGCTPITALTAGIRSHQDSTYPMMS